MSSSLLRVYLQDHHAGATAGLALARRTAHSNRDTAYGPELGAIADEIAGDVESLERIMESLGVGPDRRKDSLAWIGEKVGRLKRNGTWLSYSPLSRLVEIEGLVVGVTGKAALWEALLASNDGELPASPDVAMLLTRAADQRTRLEALRKQAAAEAFKP